ncbi:hypothetical protein L1987_45197 [Smallanthus sonchifolius]|uniref:Uncharacterized protein n=1 Tax=Smallanthus sonchifolius TaxID=185202 RepID=A0ACB9GSK5_9ASTR|nr:hypothetical protein L1987_45197 [Smallanthus sonchifolius]
MFLNSHSQYLPFWYVEKCVNVGWCGNKIKCPMSYSQVVRVIFQLCEEIPCISDVVVALLSEVQQRFMLSGVECDLVSVMKLLITSQTLDQMNWIGWLYHMSIFSPSRSHLLASGMLNIVSGFGPSASAALASHMNVDKGQCFCAGRAHLYVHERVYDEFLEKAKAFALKCVVGDPFKKGVEQGIYICTPTK